MLLKWLAFFCTCQIIAAASLLPDSSAHREDVDFVRNVFSEVFVITPVITINAGRISVIYESDCELTLEHVNNPREFLFWFTAVQARLIIIDRSREIKESVHTQMRPFIANLIDRASATLSAVQRTPEAQFMLDLLKALSTGCNYDAEQDDWIKYFASIAGIAYPFQKEDFERTALGSKESLAYRMLTYTALLFPPDPSKGQLEASKMQLFDAFVGGFHANELPDYEMKFFLIAATACSAYADVLFAVLKLRPVTPLAQKTFELLQKINLEKLQEGHLWVWAHALRPSNLLLLMMFTRYGSLRPKMRHLPNEDHFRSKGRFNRLVSIEKNGPCSVIERDDISGHFLSPEQLSHSTLPIPNSIAHNPALMCTDSAVLERIREQPHDRQFIITPLDDDAIHARITHFQAHLCMEDFGEETWQAGFPEHKELDSKIRAFIEEMFSVLGWLIRRRSHEANIVYRGRDSIGSGLCLDALQLMSSVIFLPEAQLFRYDMKLGGFVPLPTLSSTYFALIAALHTRLLTKGLGFEWQLAPIYGRFLHYEDVHKILIDDLVKTIYQKELNQFAALAECANVNEFYSSLLQTHRPFALDYPFESPLPANPYPFLNPIADIERQEAMGLRTDGSFLKDARPAATESDADALTLSFVEFFKEHLMLGRFEYQRHLLLRIDMPLWNWSTYDFWNELLTDMSGHESTFDAIWTAMQFDFPSQYKAISVLNDEPCPEYPDQDIESRTVLERILRGYSHEMLMKFFWFCTALRRIPLHGMQQYPIKVKMQRPQPDPEGSQAFLAIPWPNTRTCFRTLYWVVSPTYSACRDAFDKTLEHAIGFEIDEMHPIHPNPSSE